MPMHVREGKSGSEVSSAVKAVLAQGGGSIGPHKVEHVHLGTPKAWIIVPLLGIVLLLFGTSIYARSHRPKTDFRIDINAPDQTELKKASGIWGIERYKGIEGISDLLIVAPGMPMGADLKFRRVDKDGWILNPDDPHRLQTTDVPLGKIDILDVYDPPAVYVAVSGRLSNGTVVPRSHPLVFKIVSSGLVSKIPGGLCYGVMHGARL